MSEGARTETKPLVLYHGGCDDGFGGALAAWLKLGDSAQYVGLEFGKDPPDVRGRDVVMIDFAPYPEGWYRECGAKSMVILDHHKSAEANLAGLPRDGFIGGRPIKVVFDMNRSGATIAWEHFHPGKPVPEFFRYLEDRDLFRNSLPGCEAFTMALRSYPQEFWLWKVLASKESMGGLVDEGTSILRFYDRKCEEVAKTARRMTVEVAPGAIHRVPVVNCPWFMGSDVCHRLAEGEPFALYWYTRGDDVCWGARSRADSERALDVSEIAKFYGGGGHKHAAGWVVKDGVLGNALQPRGKT